MLSSNTSMRTIGLIGGTSWHSTIDYYTYINQKVNEAFQNNTNPPLLLINLNQKQIHDYQKENKWDSIAIIFLKAIEQLSLAGAQAVIFCANTPHKVYDTVSKSSPLPILHIADGTGNAIAKQKIKKVGLLATIYTTENDFISGRIYDQFGIETVIPELQSTRIELQRIIEEELTYGILKESSKQYLLMQIFHLQIAGAEGIILGCTEFPLLIKQEDISLPVFNTTHLHAQMAVDFILQHS